jgi:hypothetical protein
VVEFGGRWRDHHVRHHQKVNLKFELCKIVNFRCFSCVAGRNTWKRWEFGGREGERERERERERELRIVECGDGVLDMLDMPDV